MIGDGRLQLTEAAPGSQTWLAQLNANMLVLNDTSPAQWLATAGETISAGDIVALESDGLFYLADSNHASVPRRNAFGVALSDAASSATFVVRLRGPLESTAHGFSLASILYLSETAGAFTTTPPTTPRIVGMVLTANLLWLDCPRSWAAA